MEIHAFKYTLILYHMVDLLFTCFIKLLYLLTRTRPYKNCFWQNTTTFATVVFY